MSVPFLRIRASGFGVGESGLNDGVALASTVAVGVVDAVGVLLPFDALEQATPKYNKQAEAKYSRARTGASLID
jgi:hypothetical protein